MSTPDSDFLLNPVLLAPPHAVVSQLHETTSSLPEAASSLPDTASSLPDTASSLPDTASSLTETTSLPADIASVTSHTTSPPSKPTAPTPDDITLASNLSLQAGPQLYVSQPPTHAGRMSDGLLQGSNMRMGPNLSNAQKATKKIQQEAKRVQQEHFNEEFDSLLEKQFNELCTFAELHDKKVEHLQKLINSSSHYKPKRAVNLENAKLHAKSLEVNVGRAQGDCAKLPELRQLVKEDLALQNLSEESQKVLKDGVLAMRDVKKVGTRPSNKACALDYRSEVRELNDRVSSSLDFSLLYFAISD